MLVAILTLTVINSIAITLATVCILAPQIKARQMLSNRKKR